MPVFLSFWDLGIDRTLTGRQTGIILWLKSVSERGFSLAVDGSQVYRLCCMDTKGRRNCYWSRNLFQYDFLDKLHQYADDSTTGQPFTIHIFFSPFSLLYKKVYKNTSTIHSMKEFVNFWKKCSCITDHVCHFPSHSLCHYLSSGSLFLDKDHEGDSQYWGLTVGGQTGARFTQRKVQIKLGQSVQGVQEFRCCQGAAAAKREGW